MEELIRSIVNQYPSSDGTTDVHIATERLGYQHKYQYYSSTGEKFGVMDRVLVSYGDFKVDCKVGEERQAAIKLLEYHFTSSSTTPTPRRM